MNKLFGNLFITASCFILLNICSIGFSLPVNTFGTHLSKIETSLWGFEYQNDTEGARLSRIEQNVFGTVNQKDTVEKRIEKINQALGFESQKEAQSSVGELMQEEPDGVSYPQIDQLEMKLFSKVYDKENIYKRIERLEKKIFGSPQEGDLASRTDKLKGYLNIDTEQKAVYSKDNYGGSYDSYSSNSNPYNGYDPSYDTYGSDIGIQISGLEQSLFGKTFSQDPTGLRLNRLERKIFQRDFSGDDDIVRMQRLQAAASAKKTAKYYDMNKAQKFTSTGLQIGTIILMILAMIL